MVSVHRAPHLLRYRALEVRPVRLRARSLASAAPCKRLLGKDIAHMGHFIPVNGYMEPSPDKKRKIENNDRVGIGGVYLTISSS